VYRWERGEADPHPRLLTKWAEALGVEVDELNEILWSGSAMVRPVSGGEAESLTTDELNTGDPELTILETTEDPSLAADIIDLSFDEPIPMTFPDAVVRLLGVDFIPADERSSWRIAVAMPSFQGSSSIRSVATKQHGMPASFVQAADDISNDYFFGKRDVVLSNQIASALASVGFRFPMYLDDKTVWQRMAEMADGSDEALVVEHEGDEYQIDMLIVVGLWSNLLATWAGIQPF